MSGQGADGEQETQRVTEAFGGFLASWSREIRNPMNAVIGITGLLLDTPLYENQRRFAEAIRESGDAVLGMLNESSTSPSPKPGTSSGKRQPFDVRGCVESVLALMADRAEQKHLHLAYLIEPGVPGAIVGDVSRLRQILVTLVGNSIKFTDEGEVVISVNVEELTDEAGTGEGRRHRLTFSVRDTAPAPRGGRLRELFGTAARTCPLSVDTSAPAWVSPSTGIWWR